MTEWNNVMHCHDHEMCTVNTLHTKDLFQGSVQIDSEEENLLGVVEFARQIITNIDCLVKPNDTQHI